MNRLEILILIPVALYVALRLILGVMIVVTHLLETRPVCSLAPKPPDDPWTEAAAANSVNPYEAPRTTSAYSEIQNARAEAMAFVPHGRFVQSKYSVQYALWEPSSRTVLVVIGWGTVAKIKVDKTIFFTLLEDGRYLVTSDKPTGVQAPWLLENEIALNADFDRLVQVHHQRLRTSRQAIRPFSNADAQADYREYRTRLIQSSVDRGEAYYVNPDQSAVRSTLKGAILAFFRTLRPPKVVRA